MLVSAEYHSVAELAQSLNKRPQTITRKIRSREILAVRFGRDWWIPTAEFQRLTANHAVQAPDVQAEGDAQ